MPVEIQACGNFVHAESRGSQLGRLGKSPSVLTRVSH